MRARSNIVVETYLKQTFLDAFSSPDLVDWVGHKHRARRRKRLLGRVCGMGAVGHRAQGQVLPVLGRQRYPGNDQLTGIGVAVSDRPEGPFKDALGKPLIGEIRNGAQPIDQMVFKDDDGQIYMFYGGWKHANVVKLAPDLLSVLPFPDGEKFKEVNRER